MRKAATSKNSGTDWERIDAMQNQDIDLSDIPEITPEKIARAIARQGLKVVPPKQQLTLRIDRDVLEWFRDQGKGYQTQINTLLRAYMDAHKQRDR